MLPGNEPRQRRRIDDGGDARVVPEGRGPREHVGGDRHDLAADGGQRPLELRYAALGIGEGAHGHDSGGERRLDEVLALHREPSALGARRRIAQRAQLTQRRMAPAA